MVICVKVTLKTVLNCQISLWDLCQKPNEPICVQHETKECEKYVLVNALNTATKSAISQYVIMCKAKTIAKFVGTFKLKKHEGMADMIKAMGINQVHIKRAEKLPQTLVLDVKDDHFIHEHKFGPISVRQKFKIGEPFQVHIFLRLNVLHTILFNGLTIKFLTTSSFICLSGSCSLFPNIFIAGKRSINMHINV